MRAFVALCNELDVLILYSFYSHSTFLHGKYFVRAQYCVRAQAADCALTKYCFPAKFASTQNI